MKNTNQTGLEKTELTVVTTKSGRLDEVTQEINRLRGELHIAARTTAEKAITIGGLLREVKDLVRRGHWMTYRDTHFSGLSESTAQRWMKAHKKYADKALHSVNLPDLAVSEVYKLLAAPKPPKKKVTATAKTKAHSLDLLLQRLAAAIAAAETALTDAGGKGRKLQRLTTTLNNCHKTAVVLRDAAQVEENGDATEDEDAENEAE